MKNCPHHMLADVIGSNASRNGTNVMRLNPRAARQERWCRQTNSQDDRAGVPHARNDRPSMFSTAQSPARFSQPSGPPVIRLQAEPWSCCLTDLGDLYPCLSSCCLQHQSSSSVIYAEVVLIWNRLRTFWSPMAARLRIDYLP